MKDSHNEVFKSSNAFVRRELNMELSISQVQSLNNLLPARFKIDFAEQKLFKTRKPELEQSSSFQLPEKRLTREKEPDFLIGKSDEFKKCYKLLQSLKNNLLSNKILARAESLGNSDFIEEFIGLNTGLSPIQILEDKLISGEYLSAYHLGSDIRKLISSAFLVNSKDGEAFAESFEFSTLFETQFKPLENYVFSDNIAQDLNKKIEKLTQSLKDAQSKISQTNPIKDKKMNNLEKKQLVQSLKKLEPKYLSGVLKIVKGCMSIQGDELEFDLEKLPNKICRELEKYIKQCLQIKSYRRPQNNELTKTEAPAVNSRKELEPLSESSESSSSSNQSDDEMPGVPLYPNIIDHN